MSTPEPTLFAHLLGAAFLALLTGYIFGLMDLKQGKDISNVVWVGIVSNGVAFLILLLLAGQWSKWGVKASIYLWTSAAMTLLITLGLIVFGVLCVNPFSFPSKPINSTV